MIGDDDVVVSVNHMHDPIGGGGGGGGGSGGSGGVSKSHAWSYRWNERPAAGLIIQPGSPLIYRLSRTQLNSVYIHPRWNIYYMCLV